MPTADLRLPRLGGLDGLRALAVIGVVIYHLMPPVLGGGFIGVDVFFVISGFLITTLLLHERWATGRVRLGRFWMRRVRRLAPALVAMLLVCTAIAGAIGGDVLVGIDWQLIGGATFSFNWLAIADGTSYFAATSPELYRNLWSLAVEEQFYLIWPLSVLALLLLRPRRRVLVVTALAAASAIAMLVLFQLGADPTRVYFGTDTHSFGLLCGAALALWLVAERPRPPGPPGLLARIGLSLWALVLLLLLVAAAMLLSEDGTATYRGGLLLVSVVTALLIWTLTRAPWIGRWLDVSVLRYLGRRSYGLYLWHWPLLVLVAAALPGSRTDPLAHLGGTMICLVLTVLAAEASFRWLESPVRTRGFRAVFRSLGTGLRRGPRNRRAAISLTAVLAIVLGAGSASAVASAPEQSSAELAIARGQASLTPPPAPPDGAVATAAQPVSPAVPPDSSTAPISESPPSSESPPMNGYPPAAQPSPPPSAATPAGDQISAIGDSVMLAAAPELQAAFPGIAIDAAVSRQTTEGAAIVRTLSGQGQLRQYLVIALGTNGDCADWHFQEIVDAAGPSRQLVFVNVAGPMAWGATVNERLQRIAAANPNVTVADWMSAIAPHGDLLAEDGIHPAAAGGSIYAAAVTAALERTGTP